MGCNWITAGERDNADLFKTKGLDRELKNEKENLKRFKNEEKEKVIFYKEFRDL